MPIHIIGTYDLKCLMKEVVDAHIRNDNNEALDDISDIDESIESLSPYAVNKFLLGSNIPYLQGEAPLYPFVARCGDFVLLYGALVYEPRNTTRDRFSESVMGALPFSLIKTMIDTDEIISNYFEAGKIRKLPYDFIKCPNGCPMELGSETQFRDLFTDEEVLNEFIVYYFNMVQGGPMITSSIREIAKELTFGIEVEFETDENDWRNFDRFRRIVSETFPKWTIKTDGSVYNGGEVNSPVYKFATIHKAAQDLEAMLTFLNDRGCATHKTAGIHIHVSVRRSRRNDTVWGVRTILNTLKLFLKHEDMMYRIATSGWTTHRGKSNGFEYCAPISRMDGISSIIKQNSITDLRMYEPSRYYGCNICSWWAHNTLEFRVFNSSLNPERILKYAQICVAIVAKAIYHAANSLEIELTKKCIIYGTMAMESAEKKLEVENRFFEELELNKDQYAMVLTSDFQ